MGLKSTATRLIKKHGHSATLLRLPEPTSDGSGGSIYGPSIPFDVIILPASVALELEPGRGGFFNASKGQVIVSTEGLAEPPTTIDFIRIGDVEHPIRQVNAHAPTGETHFYLIEVGDA